MLIKERCRISGPNGIVPVTGTHTLASEEKWNSSEELWAEEKEGRESGSEAGGLEGLARLSGPRQGLVRGCPCEAFRRLLPGTGPVPPPPPPLCFLILTQPPRAE